MKQEEKVLRLAKAGLLEDLKKQVWQGAIRPSAARNIMELIVVCEVPEQLVALRLTTMGTSPWGEA